MLDITVVPSYTRIYFNILDSKGHQLYDVADSIKDFLNKSKVDYQNLTENGSYNICSIDISFEVAGLDLNEMKRLCNKIAESIESEYNVYINICQIGG